MAAGPSVLFLLYKLLVRATRLSAPSQLDSTRQISHFLIRCHHELRIGVPPKASARDLLSIINPKSEIGMAPLSAAILAAVYLTSNASGSFSSVPRKSERMRNRAKSTCPPWNRSRLRINNKPHPRAKVSRPDSKSQGFISGWRFSL